MLGWSLDYKSNNNTFLAPVMHLSITPLNSPHFGDELALFTEGNFLELWAVTNWQSSEHSV